MALIKRRGLDTIDYTLLQKKGFIKKPAEKKSLFNVNSSGIVDFTSVAKENNALSSSQATVQSEPSSPLSFFDSFSQNAGTIANSGSEISTATNFLNQSDSEVNFLKIKIDDLEYKLAQLVDKLSLIECKLGNFESKISG